MSHMTMKLDVVFKKCCDISSMFTKKFQRIIDTMKLNYMSAQY